MHPIFMDKIIRHGAYGIILEKKSILLTQKKSGPYEGLWGLPGGAIEFGETPEETLKREILEETALAAGPLTLLHIATHTCDYIRNGHPCGFHQVGIIYRVAGATPLALLVPEEKMRWFPLDAINTKELTPFAQDAVSWVKTGNLDSADNPGSFSAQIGS